MVGGWFWVFLSSLSLWTGRQPSAILLTIKNSPPIFGELSLRVLDRLRH